MINSGIVAGADKLTRPSLLAKTALVRATLIADINISGGATFTQDIDIGDPDPFRYFIATWTHGRSVAAGTATNRIPSLGGTSFLSSVADWNDMLFGIGLLRVPLGTGTQTFSLQGGATISKAKLFKVEGGRLIDQKYWTTSGANGATGFTMDGKEGDWAFTSAIGDQDHSTIMSGQDAQIGTSQDFTWSPNLQRNQCFEKLFTMDGTLTAEVETSASSCVRGFHSLLFRPDEKPLPEREVEMAFYDTWQGVDNGRTVDVFLGDEHPDRTIIVWHCDYRNVSTGSVNANATATLNGVPMSSIDIDSTFSGGRFYVWALKVPTGTGFRKLVLSGSTSATGGSVYVVRTIGYELGEVAKAAAGGTSKIEATISYANIEDIILAFGAREGDDLDATTREVFDTAGRDKGRILYPLIRGAPMRSRCRVMDPVSDGAPFTAGTITPAASVTYQSIHLLRLIPTSGGTSWESPVSSGERRNLITLTGVNMTPSSGRLDHWINGAAGADGSSSFSWGTVTGNGTAWALFDFHGKPTRIDGFRLLTSNTADHGDWQFEGSNDNSSWTNIYSFSMTGAGSTTGTGKEYNFTNPNTYTYYRLRHMSGDRSNAPWQREIYFRASTTAKHETSYQAPISVGDRSSLVGVTWVNIVFGAGTPAALFDGQRVSSSVPQSCWWRTATGDGSAYLLFDFGSTPRRIEGLTLVGSANTTHNLWKVEGSNDNSSWTTLVDEIILTTNNTIAWPNGSSYRYYRLTHLSGTRADTPWLREIEFLAAN